jgi:hypothetical protein
VNIFLQARVDVLSIEEMLAIDAKLRAGRERKGSFNPHHFVDRAPSSSQVVELDVMPLERTKMSISFGQESGEMLSDN